MANSFAFLMVFVSPIIVLLIMRKLPAHYAIVAVVLGGYLLLPNGASINLPALPTINKHFTPSASALLFCLLGLAITGAARPDLARRGVAAARSATRAATNRLSRRDAASRTAPETAGGPWINKWIPALLIGKLLLLLIIMRPFGTVMTNLEPLSFGPTFIPGQRIYDAFSFTLTQMVALLPFILGHRYLGGEEGQRAVLFGFLIAALAYSIPMLLEVRLSPQLHRWVYGIFPHRSFAQTVRDGGFRPVVFLTHPLWVSIFVAMALVAAASLWRDARGAIKARLGLATAYLFIILIFCKSLGALAIAALLAPAARIFSPRPAILMAAAIASALLAYPALRDAGLVPTQQILSVVSSFNEERAASFKTRLDNEDSLLAKADQKPFFGWSGFGRSRIFDPTTGRDLTIADGRWIILIGVAGWVGYVAEYGLLCLPIILLGFRHRRYRPSNATAGVCLLLTANLIDMIPNGTLTPITWLAAGALFGRLSAVEAARRAESAARSRPRAGRRSPGPAGQAETPPEPQTEPLADPQLAGRRINATRAVRTPAGGRRRRP